MSESLMMRVKRLMSGSVHGAVDAMENAAPELVMRESIREVERAIDDVREELAREIASSHHAHRRIAMAKGRLDELHDKARLAVEQGRDDLAQVALSRQIDIEAQIPLLETTAKDAAAKQAELDGYVAALNGRKEAASKSGADVVAGGRSSVERRTENAQGAFDRAYASVSGMPGVSKPDREQASKLNELDGLSRQVDVAARLDALKAMRKAG
jgi:phage shock protein A